MHPSSEVAQLIGSQASSLALTARNLSQSRGPHMTVKPGEPDGYLEDARLHICSLSDAMLGASERIFVDYVDWARSVNAARNRSDSYLEEQLTSVRGALRDQLPEVMESADTFLSAALARLATPRIELTCSVAPDTLAASYIECLLAYDRNGALALVSAALDEGTSLPDLYLEVIQVVQHELGRLWQLNRITVAQEHYCTAVSQLVLAQLYPRMLHGSGGPRMVATCPREELHEFGARMVADFFEMDGWDTTYLGANAPADGVLHVLRERRASLLAISVTMSHHLHDVLSLIEQVRAAPDLRHLTILVGGRPFSAGGNLWQRLGADGCANDAQHAVSKARSLLGG
jgi:MerR family transcriptional regulator, light-induced transcriptional regulator